MFDCWRGCADWVGGKTRELLWSWGNFPSTEVPQTSEKFPSLRHTCHRNVWHIADKSCICDVSYVSMTRVVQWEVEGNQLKPTKPKQCGRLRMGIYKSRVPMCTTTEFSFLEGRSKNLLFRPEV